jgi:DNA-directed RNA polymerase subunit L
MKVSILEKKDGVLEIECDDKLLPNAILAALIKNKVDAYTYEPHPLIPAYRLHIEADNPMKELTAALKAVEGEWSKFEKELMSKIKPAKAEKKAAKKK